MPIRKHHNESVQIVNYYCHQCRQQILFLSPLGRCCECNSEFIEEDNGNVSLADNRNTSQSRPQSSPNKSNAMPSKQQNILEKSVDDCSICLEALATDSTKKMCCGHRFHARCIDPWLNTHMTCPLCRKVVAKAKVPPVPDVRNGINSQILEYTIQSLMRPLLMPEIRMTRTDFFAAESLRLNRNHQRSDTFGTARERVFRSREHSRR